ncbi:hypothetical protein HJFPF1_11958 [Paramyrothecium foliicola]|nr:hypothetical protein HJFPF1_11958 [Paramyrothecium foliicola]
MANKLPFAFLLLFHPCASIMDSTPLLQAVGGLAGPNTMQDHPAFLRASHSPWRFIPQNILVILRGTILAYLTAVGVMTAHYKLTQESDYTNWRHLFDFGIVSFGLVIVYHVITFSWTFTHLYYPHRDAEGGIEEWIIRAMSLPNNMGSLRKQFYFTMFYTLAIVFSFMNSTIYWFITRQNQSESREPAPPQESGSPSEGESVVWTWGSDTNNTSPIPQFPFSDLFGEGWFKPFIVFNIYAIMSIIMVLEILFLNSIKRPYAIGSHLFGLVFCSGFYLSWAAIGKLLTDWYAFDWLDEAKVGSQEAVTAYCIGFVILAPIMYTLMQGFVGIREGLTRSLSDARAVAAAQESLES